MVAVLVTSVIWPAVARPEQGRVRIEVLGMRRQHLASVVLALKGGGYASRPTDDGGFTEIEYVFDQAKPFKISLFVKRPEGLFFVSPDGGRVPLPPCKAIESECFESVVLARRGERVGQAEWRSIATAIADASVPQLLDEGPESFRVQALNNIALGLGSKPADVDKGIRELASAPDVSPRDRALAAVAVGQWTLAEEGFQSELGTSTTDQRTRAESSRYLASALYGQARYADAATIAQTSVALEPAVASSLNLWGLALARSNTDGAETAFGASGTDAAAYNAAVLRLERHDLEAARQAFEELVEAPETSSAIRESARRRLREMPQATAAAPLFPLYLLLPVFVMFVIFVAVKFSRGTLAPRGSKIAAAAGVVFFVAVVAFNGPSFLTSLKRLPYHVSDSGQPNVTFSGTVSDGAGKAIAGAMITVLDPYTRLDTSVDGRFALTVDRNEVIVRAESPGFEPAVALAQAEKPDLKITLSRSTTGEPR